MPEPGVHIVQTAALRHTGMVRSYQEDAFLIGWSTGDESWDWKAATFRAPMPEGGILLAVADGMGGLNAGDVASALAVEEVKKNFSPFGQVPVQQAVVVLRQAIINAHFTIEIESEKPENGEMGSTLVIAWLLGDMLHVAWVGDSRCYRFRREEGLKLLTKDHSLVQDLLDEGAITEAEAFEHPHRNVITQSLGIRGRDPEPDYASAEILPGDLLLLCSDGLNTMLTDEEIASVCEKTTDPEQCAEKLIAAANEAGGHDNISVVLAWVEDNAGFEMEQKIQPVAVPVYPKKTGRQVPRLFWMMLPLVMVLSALTIWAVKMGKIGPSKKPASTETTVQDTTAVDAAISQEADTTTTADSTVTESSLAIDSLPESVSWHTGNFVVVANSFSRLNEAEQMLRKLKKRYPNFTILIEKNKDGLHEVRITGFKSRPEANSFHLDDPDLTNRIIRVATENNN